MKFGEQFLLSQRPEWEPHYLPYRQLKALLKLAKLAKLPTSDNSDFREFYSLLKSRVSSLCTFFQLQYSLLKSKEKVFHERNTRGSSSLVPPNLSLIKHSGYEYAFSGYTELLKAYGDLQKFCRLNHEATLRIHTKQQRADESSAQQGRETIDKFLEEQVHNEKACLQEMERLQELLHHLEESSKVPETDTQMIDISHVLKLVGTEIPELLPCINTITGLILKDENTQLGAMVEKVHSQLSGFPNALQALFHIFITLSISCQAWSCANDLLTHTLADVKAIIDHSGLNHLLEVIGRNASREGSHLENGNSSFEESATTLALEMAKQLWTTSNNALQMLDALGRVPLHYCGQYGLKTICQFILASLHDQPQDYSLCMRSILLADDAGLTPLHYSVIHGHIEVTKLFLNILAGNHKEWDISAIDNLLMVSLKQQDDWMVGLLLSVPINFSHIFSSGETCLHIACQIGRQDYVEMLLETINSLDINLDAREKAYGWTPLFISSQRGNLSIVDMLLRAGADGTLLDHLGWTAKDHATFRGHLPIAERFEENENIEVSRQLARRPVGIPNSPKHHVQPGAAHLVVNLGIMQKGRQIKPVDLKYSPGANHDNSLSLVISTSTETNTSHTLRLPLLDDPVLNTLVFPIDKPSEVQLIFKLLRVSAVNNKEDTLIGSGMAFLETNSSGCGEHRESLIRECSVPLLRKEDMGFMGTITFTPIIAEAFPHLNTPTATFDYLKNLDASDLVGHRGSGGNDGERRYLQVGENTVQSFISAAKLGAAHVEFDVQLTRDLVPVLYHDFSLSESGTDIPIHDLTVEQFMHASKLQGPQSETRFSSSDERSQGDHRYQRPRSQSLTQVQENGTSGIQERMKHTVDFINKGFKPNTRGDSIHTSFATLEDALRNVPESVGFNIEIKYPRIHEAVAAGVAPVAIDINTFIDKTLDVISRYAGSRNIILSSFTPEICILLAIKQKAYPVLFITNAGKRPIVDKEQRAGSLQVAVHFAEQWGLAGIVFASDALVMCPRLIDYVKKKGLVCGTYGAYNNIPETVVLQAKAGVDLIVSDRVGRIAKVLKSLT